MMQKMFDLVLDGSGSNGEVHCTSTEDKEASIVVECECGSHMLKLSCLTDIYHQSDGRDRVHQDFNLAMFGFGNQKRKLFSRLGIAIRYLWTGKMHDDQLILSPDEARKVLNFIDNNLIETVE